MSSFFRAHSTKRRFAERTGTGPSPGSRRNQSRRSFEPTLETLEDRLTPALANWTAADQLMLQLVNQARANPAAVAAKYGIALNAGLAPGTLSAAAEAPLAPQQILINTAAQHSNEMYTHNYFDHANLIGQSSWQRAMAAGYPTSYVGENIAWGTYNTTYNTQEQAVEELAQELFLSAPHRQNMLNALFNEVGVGVTFGQSPYQSAAVSGLGVAIDTEDFGYRAGVVYLTGVAYTDSVNANHFYDIGEALGGVVITAVSQLGQRFTTTTSAPGGYALPVTPGTYTVTASGGGLAQPITMTGVRVGSLNVELDFVPGQTVSVAATPQLAPIPGQQLSRGQTLYVALRGSDPNGATLTYLATVSGYGGAAAPAVAVSISGSSLSLTPPPSFVGAFLVNVTASDGSSSVSQTFKVTVMNHAPQIAAIANQLMSVSQGTLNVALPASDADGDALTYQVSIQANSQLYALEQQLKLYVSGNSFYTNWWGLGEKWLRSAVNGSWYYILPSGVLYLAGSIAATSSPVAALGTAVFANPALLYQASAPAAVPVNWSVTGNTLSLVLTGSYRGSFRVVVTASDGQANVSRSFLVTLGA